MVTYTVTKMMWYNVGKRQCSIMAKFYHTLNRNKIGNPRKPTFTAAIKTKSYGMSKASTFVS